MPKSRKRKNHKKRVEARNERLINERKNQSRKIIENLIKQEQEMGKFDNTQSIDDKIAGPEF